MSTYAVIINAHGELQSAQIERPLRGCEERGRRSDTVLPKFTRIVTMEQLRELLDQQIKLNQPTAGSSSDQQ